MVFPKRALGVAAFAVGAMTFALGSPQNARAADHGDSQSVLADPATDIADLFAWMSPDSNMVNLVMTFSAMQFSNNAQYVFHVLSSNDLMAFETTNVICTFDTAQMVSCWVGDADYVTGDPANTSGLLSTSGMTRVYAGQRNDPFFFDLTAFNSVVDTVAMAAPNLMFDTAGCPTLDMMTSNALVMGLAGGMDTFQGLPTNALVLQIDKSLLTAGGPLLAVSGATYTP